MSDPVAALLEAGRARLLRTPDPLREARMLLAHAAGLPREGFHRLDPGDLSAPVRARYEGFLARRADGEPVSRILGYRDFWRHRFSIAPGVLDPRPETETLVAEALRAPFDRVLDLGTGSGCVLLSLLADRERAFGVGTDISPAALEVAAGNAAALGLAARARLVRSDWFDAVEGGFDLIVSNPPYIAADELAGLEPEVRDHDPPAALSPGAEWLAAYRAILAGVRRHLAPGGRLLVEIGWRQGPAVEAMFRGAGLVAVAIRPDLEGRDRVVGGIAPQ